ncbi:MAG: transposase [Pirellulaceae bacterium]|nr:transposase [Pirellulaceae bacterium]
MPTPFYTAENCSTAYHLHYTWTGWPTAGTCFGDCPDLTQLDEQWQADGLRRIEVNWSNQQVQFTFSVTPAVIPTFFTGRVKGRLQHALREAGTPVKFSRKVCFRAIGDNHSDEVQKYIAQQVPKERFVDPRFEQMLLQFTKVSNVDRFQEPLASNSGRYWYNLHVVLVVAGRGHIESRKQLEMLDEALEATAAKHQYDLVARSWLLDHLHIGMRGNISESPLEIALSIMNNTAYRIRRSAFWQSGFYVGSFSEYDLNAVRTLR